MSIKNRRRRARFLVLALWSILAGLGIAAPAVADTPPLEGPFATYFNPLDPPAKAPPVAFRDLNGDAVRLSDFHGKVVVLNFWATWCPPCIREMPSLDRLQAALGAEGLAVVAISLDRGGREVVTPFAKKLGLTRMGLYLDPKWKLARPLGLSGLPTTYIIERGGGIVGVVNGPAEWDGPEAVALLRHYLGKPARSGTRSQSTAAGTVPGG